eukprot:TRINITY_DN3027_c0_g1_i21.p1 TRINITY_DN3027_c0_g1~~TRINITY_DN3027_c0_g1_i21.p1  ORF type:complete len:452 (-),score=48.43 TRINITY_DN3027_c0_g1_i21:76-1431(-)
MLQLVKSYSAQSKGELTYSEFLSLVLPVKNIVLRRLSIARNTKHKHSNTLPLNISIGFRKLILEEVELIRRLRPFQLELTNCSGYKIYQLFELVVEDKCRFITKQGLRCFMKKCGSFMLDADAAQIVQRLDRDRDGKVSYLDFLNSVLPGEICRNDKKESQLVEDHDAIKHKGSIPREDEAKRINNPTQEEGKDAFRTPERIGFGSPEYPTTGETPVKITTPTAPEQLQRYKQSLAKLFKYQLEIDKRAEELKERVCKQADYSVKSVIILFTKEKRDSVSLYELKRGLNLLGVYSDTKELIDVMKRYDLDRDGAMNRGEFERMLLPLNKQLMKIQEEKVDRRGLSKETMLLLQGLFLTIINNETAIEKMRHDMDNNTEIKITDLAETFKDLAQDSGLHIAELKNLMNETGNYIENAEAELLMQRYDKNIDGNISFVEFMREMTPTPNTNFA